ncbi:uncharacterized protein YecT (DUF1311 family) [Povalibacter uvarum]|uniref:Uncharacterized protein YecT (DUF1311 family) n=1 Tax=Povalibacter uvarum TaxID=732238 RepID=A0A841HGN6_9GAMM|nr:ankyrin repeat domain-containing protein [Povalibacter uvarum]MBB6092291.1 uncharacterized protein YecT (DUF1311 family) [Povalibacter uvarum]
MIATRFASIGVVLCLLGCISVQAASFDCTQARSRTEKLICGDTELSDLDARLGEAYTVSKQGLAPAEVERLTREQLQWLRDVRNRCTDAACLKEKYKTRIDELDPLADKFVTCEDMQRWPRRIFRDGIDLGSGHGSPTDVNYRCPGSLNERDFMRVLLGLAEAIRNEDSSECTGSIVHAHWRYYHLRLAEGGISPRTLPAWPTTAGSADWTAFAQEDDSGTATYFRQWSERSLVNRAMHEEFAREFDKAAAQLVNVYRSEFGLSQAEAGAAAKRALGTVVNRAAGSAPDTAKHKERAVFDVLRAGPIDPAQVRDALKGLNTADVEQALRIALIHDQPVSVVAAIEEQLPREQPTRRGAVPEPLLSLALNELPNVEYLLGKQYPVDAANEFGKTALFYAIGEGNHAAVELLIRHGADVRHTYKSATELRPDDDACVYAELRHTRRSTLMHAAQNSDERMLKILLGAGAPVDARDDLGFNAYDYAVMGERQDNVRYLASLGQGAAAPMYSSDPDESVRDHGLSSTLKIDGYVERLATPRGRSDLLVAVVTPWKGPSGPTTGLHLISIATPDQPRVVGVVPGVRVADLALSPDGKRIYFIELANQASARDRKYGLSVLDVSNAAEPSLLTQVEGDFTTMHLAADGRTLYLQERQSRTGLSRGLLVYDVGSDAPAMKCSNSFGQTRYGRPVSAAGFASFPDEPLLALADDVRDVTLFDVRDPCRPKKVMQTRLNEGFNPASMLGGAARTLTTSGPKTYRLTDSRELQASYRGNREGSFHVNAATGLTVAVFDNDLAVLRTRPTGTYVLTDRFPRVPDYPGGVVSTDAGYVYVGWNGGLGVGAVPLRSRSVQP